MLFQYSRHAVETRERDDAPSASVSCSCGYSGHHLANLERIRLGRVQQYCVPSNEQGLPAGKCVMAGSFLVASDYVESHEAGAIFLIGIRGARTVSAVMRSVDSPAVVRVLCNLRALGEDMHGRAVAADSTVAVTRERASYELLASREPHDGVVSLQVVTGSVRVYSFTFSS